MSVKICGQTLILVDNDKSLTDVNQKIIKQTLKYMLYHTPENRAYCISNYGHEIEGDEVYSTDVNDLLCQVDLMEFEAKDSNLVDTLCKVITNWKDSDFACRDIVVFTDGIEGVELEFRKEELFYLIDKTNYPIYIVDLVQEDNKEAKRDLSAIATTSDGKLFLSEFEGDDGGVDKQLSDGIFEKMEEYAKREWYVYEEEAGDVENESETDNANKAEDSSGKTSSQTASTSEETDIENDEEANEEIKEEKKETIAEKYMSNVDLEEKDIQSVVYETPREKAFYENEGLLYAFLVIAIAVIVGGLAFSLMVLKNRRKDAKKTEEIKELAQNAADDNSFFERTDFSDMFCMNSGSVTEAFNDYDEEKKTQLLSEFDDNPTLLLNTINEHELFLTEVENAQNVLTMRIRDKLIVGRSNSASDYCIDDDFMSKRHCEFSYEENDYYIKDLESSNGTYVNGKRISKLKLKQGDKIKLGRKVYCVKWQENSIANGNY